MFKIHAYFYKRTLSASLAGLIALAGCSSGTDQQASKTENEEQTASEQQIVADQAMYQMRERMVMQQAEKRAVRSDLVLSRPLAFSGVVAQESRERYQRLPENGVFRTSEQPVSTFSIDVDTGSYTNVRRMLNQGTLPPADAVRIEEFINYFDYQYPRPTDQSEPFTTNTAISVSPWEQGRHLLRVGIQGFKPETVNQPANLVFLIDVSGSMRDPNKLPLLKRSLALLVDQLKASDRVSLVVYAGASGVVLEPTDGDNKEAIKRALENLQAGGSTNGGEGIHLAYSMARQGFIENGINRVVLATDGDFNVGTVDHHQLVDLIKRYRQQGIALTTLGFGQGNYNDALMEQLADAGNGNYAYIDTIREARKVLVDELSASMLTIAGDVKVQVEFNPAVVSEYRLIGYENRLLSEEDFSNDKVDAGEIGAGHNVTALYEVTLAGSQSGYLADRRYGPEKISVSGDFEGELAVVKIRYKQPGEIQSRELERIVSLSDIKPFEGQAGDFRFAVAVAGFGQLLRDSKFAQGLNYTWLIDTAQQSKGNDPFGLRSEMVQLMRTAEALTRQYGANTEVDRAGESAPFIKELVRIEKRRHSEEVSVGSGANG